MDIYSPTIIGNLNLGNEDGSGKATLVGDLRSEGNGRILLGEDLYLFSFTDGSFVGGGKEHCLDGATESAIVSGVGNSITITGFGCSFIGAGFSNEIRSEYSVIGGGKMNCACGEKSFIGAGYYNTTGGKDGVASNSNGGLNVVVGGCQNQACGNFTGILGGHANVIGGNLEKTFIIGSNITATKSCTTYVNRLTIVDIPNSDAGLSTGEVYSDNGTLKIKL